MINHLPTRTKPAHQSVRESGSLSPIIFLPICAKDRKPLFTCQDVHDMFLTMRPMADHWIIGRYVLMPDHIHMFCAPARNPATPLRTWIQYRKSLMSKKWPWPKEHPIWQQDGWDVQLRKGESCTGKWEYVRRNPVRAGLIDHPDKWPYQGELNVLRWHDQ